MNSIFQDNKYTRLYYNIITKHGHKQKPNDGYYERHHIIPKSMGGNDSIDNLIYVKVRVHFLLHVILVKVVLKVHQRRARWCVICFSANNDKQLIRRKLKSRFVQLTREAHNADLKLLKWFNNGIESIRIFPEESLPSGFKPGRLKLPSRAGVVYITDGVRTKRIKSTLPIPDGWTLGQKPERIKQISELGKKHKMGSGAGRVWINNGIENKYIFGTAAPNGWVFGRLPIGNFNPSALGAQSIGARNPNYSGFTDDHILEHAKLFYVTNNHINANAWKQYCKENKLPQHLVKTRFAEFGGGFTGLKRALLNHDAQFPSLEVLV